MVAIIARRENYGHFSFYSTGSGKKRKLWRNVV
jgi:hypothetical protein